jgi:ribosomal subunit interface protein
MPFRVSGRNIEVGEALRERISGRLLQALEKYFDGGFSGHVTVGKEAFGYHTECVVHLDSGIVLRAESMAADANQSADQAAEHLEKRLRRYHRRLKDYRAASRHNGRTADAEIDAPSYIIAAPEHEDDADSADFNPVIVAESTTALKRLAVSEAVLELDMTGNQVMVFRHAGHGRVNFVYRRADGNVGWIDPPAIAGA